MKIRYASAAPSTLPPIDASRRMVRHPISAIGSNGPQVVPRWTKSSARARVRPMRVSSTGWLASSASWAASELASFSVATMREVSLGPWA